MPPSVPLWLTSSWGQRRCSRLWRPLEFWKSEAIMQRVKVLLSFFLDRFIDDPEVVQRVRATFAGLYSLDRVRWKWLQEEMRGHKEEGGEEGGEGRKERRRKEGGEEGRRGTSEHADFNSLPVAYFSIQIRIHLVR